MANLQRGCRQLVLPSPSTSAASGSRVLVRLRSVRNLDNDSVMESRKHAGAKCLQYTTGYRKATFITSRKHSHPQRAKARLIDRRVRLSHVVHSAAHIGVGPANQTRHWVVGAWPKEI